MKVIQGEKDIFDDLIASNAAKAPRATLSKVEMTKHLSSDVRKSGRAFNMSGGPRKQSDSSTEDDYINELEEENKRLKSLMEYKDYELQKKKKEEEFGFDCFSELREKFDLSLQEANQRIKELEYQLNEKNADMEELQIELGAKNDEICKFEEKYRTILEQKDAQSKKEIEELKQKLTTHSNDIVEGYKAEIESLKADLKEAQDQNNKYLDEKLKIEEVMNMQVDQIEFSTNKAMKLEDELKIRKQIEDDVTKNLRIKEEEVRVLKLRWEENTIRSFDVKFVNIEESKVGEEVLVDGTVQTWQSRENSKDYFVRITYRSNKDKNMKTFKVEADRLGGIIPITDKRAAIQWKDLKGKNKKQEVEIESIEDLFQEIGNLTYR